MNKVHTCAQHVRVDRRSNLTARNHETFLKLTNIKNKPVDAPSSGQSIRALRTNEFITYGKKNQLTKNQFLVMRMEIGFVNKVFRMTYTSHGIAEGCIENLIRDQSLFEW